MKSTDVCILCGGMAGLTLARQLHRRRPDLDITIIEHRRSPVREAAHKVGESTVEIAASYLAQTLGLEHHLRTQQLPKFGLRMFLRGAEPISDDLARYDEIGVSEVLPIATYQIDRGRLENHLADSCRDAGLDLVSDATIRSVAPAPGDHRILYRQHESELALRARYVVDATGRRAWLRDQLGIARPARHPNHAVWFRVNGRVDIDAWSNDRAWRARCGDAPRRLSTNHFTGPGYWIWLIPLASEATSVGLVFDPGHVELATVNRHDRLLEWIAVEHPLVAAALANRAPIDFHVLKNYAAGCRAVFDSSGWMLTGDAGVFADPFYSPGADFIAFANGFITEMIAAAVPAERYALYQNYFLSFFSNTLSIYRGQYGGFGNRDLMVAKTLWDYSYYWGVLAKLFFTGRFVDPRFMAAAHRDLIRAGELNSGMQRAFRQVASNPVRIGGEGRFFDHHRVGLFHTMKTELLAGDSERAGAELHRNVERLTDVAATLRRSLRDPSTTGDFGALNFSAGFA